MSRIDGKWNIVMHTYMGDMRSTLEARTEGDKLFGTAVDGANGATGEIANGKIEGDKFSYDLTIRAVVGELTNHIEGTIVDDDTLSGTSSNPMGSFPMEAKRA